MRRQNLYRPRRNVGPYSEARNKTNMTSHAMRSFARDRRRQYLIRLNAGRHISGNVQCMTTLSRRPSHVCFGGLTECLLAFG